MEIERNPRVPQLNTRAIELLTELCFRNNDALQKVDGIFVYSSAINIEKVATLLNTLLSHGISKKVFITGGLPTHEVAEDLRVDGMVTEADLLLHALEEKKYTDITFFAERSSNNTLANVTETMRFREFIQCKSILFVFKSHAAGRGYLTLRKFFKTAKILQQTFDAKYEQANVPITRDNWHTFSFGQERVWGEFLRIKTYGSRGDIEFDSVTELVAQIEGEIYN